VLENLIPPAHPPFAMGQVWIAESQPSPTTIGSASQGSSKAFHVIRFDLQKRHPGLRQTQKE
jgi:hypothetical protein